MSTLGFLVLLTPSAIRSPKNAKDPKVPKVGVSTQCGEHPRYGDLGGLSRTPLTRSDAGPSRQLHRTRGIVATVEAC